MKTTIQFAMFVLVFMAAPLGQNALAQCSPDPAGPGVECPAPPFPTAPYVPPGVCGIAGLIFSSPTTLSWTFPAACPGAPVFDVVRGDLECIRAGNPVSVACEMPLPLYACGSPAMLAVEPPFPAPAPGEGYWYLVRVSGFSWNGPAGGGQATDYNAVFPDITGCP